MPVESCNVVVNVEFVIQFLLQSCNYLLLHSWDKLEEKKKTTNCKQGFDTAFISVKPNQTEIYCSGHFYYQEVAVTFHNNTCHICQFNESRLFKKFDLIFNHSLKHLVVDEPWQFSSSVLPIILGHLLFKLKVDCMTYKIVSFKKVSFNLPEILHDLCGYLHDVPELSIMRFH